MLQVFIIISLLSGEVMVEELEIVGTVYDCPDVKQAITEWYSQWASEIAKLTVTCKEKKNGI